MVLVTNKNILKKAKKGKYAIPAFNISNLEFLQVITETSQKLNSPVIIQISESALKYAGLDYIINMVHVAGKKFKIPISLHLDHGKNFDLIKRCMEFGFTSIMYDGSSLSFEENVKNTKKIVDLAKKYNISVEGELGTLSGIENHVKSNKIQYTNPDKAKEFVKKTGIDSLAIAIGTSHGAFKFNSKPKLRIDILKEITNKIKIPIVLHGASGVPLYIVNKANKYGQKLSNTKGVPDSQIVNAIKNGICKINIDTDLRLAFTAGIREHLAKNPADFNPRNILESAKKEVCKVVEHKIRLLKSVNKA